MIISIALFWFVCARVVLAVFVFVFVCDVAIQKKNGCVMFCVVLCCALRVLRVCVCVCDLCVLRTACAFFLSSFLRCIFFSAVFFCVCLLCLLVFASCFIYLVSLFFDTHTQRSFYIIKLALTFFVFFWLLYVMLLFVVVRHDVLVVID